MKKLIFDGIIAICKFYSNFDPKRQIQVFNCDLSNQEDKEEFISFLENNKKKVKNS